MFTKKPKTGVGQSLLAYQDRHRPRSALAEQGSHLARLLNAPDPHHYTDDRDHRRAVIDWETSTPRQSPGNFIVGPRGNREGSVAVCLHCLGITHYLSKSMDQAYAHKDFRDDHTCT